MYVPDQIAGVPQLNNILAVISEEDQCQYPSNGVTSLKPSINVY